MPPRYSLEPVYQEVDELHAVLRGLPDPEDVDSPGTLRALMDDVRRIRARARYLLRTYRIPYPEVLPVQNLDEWGRRLLHDYAVHRRHRIVVQQMDERNREFEREMADLVEPRYLAQQTAPRFSRGDVAGQATSRGATSRGGQPRGWSAW